MSGSYQTLESWVGLFVGDSLWVESMREVRTATLHIARVAGLRAQGESGGMTVLWVFHALRVLPADATPVLQDVACVLGADGVRDLLRGLGGSAYELTTARVEARKVWMGYGHLA